MVQKAMQNGCVNQHVMCRCTMGRCEFVGRESDCPMHTGNCTPDNGNVPSFKLLAELYRTCCQTREKSGTKDAPTTLEMNLHYLSEFVQVVGLTMDDPVTMCTRKNLLAYATERAKKVKPVSVRNSLYSIQSVFARWARMMYEDMGYSVSALMLPDIQVGTHRYSSMSEEQKIAVMKWYRSLQFRENKRARIFVMFMLKFAMRDSDVFRMKWGNFHVQNGRWVLEYTPHKTKDSSRRVVKIVVNPLDQIELEEFRNGASDEDLVLTRYGYGNGKDYFLRQLNAEMRGLGFKGSKGLYELRKACIDRVYQVRGREAAEAISGDAFKTIAHHYADVSMRVEALPDAEMVV